MAIRLPHFCDGYYDVEMRILISGTCAPELNSNYGLIQAIAGGFQKLDGLEVKLVLVNQLPEVINDWRPCLTLLVGGLALETIPLALVNHLCSRVERKLAFWSLEDLSWIGLFRRAHVLASSAPLISLVIAPIQVVACSSSFGSTRKPELGRPVTPIFWALVFVAFPL